MKQEYLAFVLVLILLAGCAAGGEAFPTPSATKEWAKTLTPGPTTTSPPTQPVPTSVPPTAPISESPSVPTPTVGNEAKETPVTITGTVKDVSFSAHTIMLREPMQGFSILAITQDTKLVSAEGLDITAERLDITLREVRPGMVIQATGRPGTHGALLPDQVRILP